MRSLADAGQSQGDRVLTGRTQQGDHLTPAPGTEPGSRYEHKGHRGNPCKKGSILGSRTSCTYLSVVSGSATLRTPDVFQISGHTSYGGTFHPSANGGMTGGASAHCAGRRARLTRLIPSRE